MTGFIRLSEIASARSGDKGNHANIGVVAASEPAYRFLRRVLTADRLHDCFRALGVTGVERYELPKVGALNFVLYNALGGGASQSLRIDTQGKLLGPATMQIELPAESDELDLLRHSVQREPDHATDGQDPEAHSQRNDHPESAGQA
jgi:hypothetical protein